MAHFVLITSEMAGRIHLTCELARRLESAGHRVTVTATADIGDRVARFDVAFRRLGTRSGDEAAPDAQRTTAPHASVAWRAAEWLRRLPELRNRAANCEVAVEALDVEGIATAISGLEPDLVVSDVELPVPVMAAWSTGAPVATWTSMLSLFKRPGLPPLGTAATPGESWRGHRAGLEWAWLTFRASKWVRLRRQSLTRFGTDQISILREVAQRTRFPLSEEADLYQWLIPFVFRTIPLLSLNVFELEFPHEPPPHVHYVGPVLAESRPVELGPADASRLAAIYDRRRTDPSRRLVYCSFGAWHKGDDRKFVERVIAAAAARPDVDMVVGLGGRLDPASLGSLPPNVHALRWAPQLDILRHADVAIHHGGISTINECIAAGVPMIVYPFDFLDQPGNAARVAYHELGERGRRSVESAEVIGARIDRVLANPAYATHLERMKRACAAADAANLAVTTLERLVPT